MTALSKELEGNVAVVREILGDTIGVSAEVSKLADFDRLFEPVRRKRGRAAVLFADAVGNEFAPLKQIAEEHFNKAFAINKPAHSHKEEPLKGEHSTHSDRDIFFEDFAAELTVAAYSVALRHGVAGTWLDLELELWRVLTEMVKKWGRESPPGSETAFVCDWAGGQPEAAHGDGRDGFGHRRDARLPLSGE